MPVSTEQKKLPVRERILETANRLFYQKGVSAVGIDRILQESGAAKASMYAHFGSKDDLVAAYLERRGKAWQDRVTEELEKRGGSARDRLLLLFDLVAESTCDREFRGCPFMNAVGELSNPDHPAHKVTRAQRKWHRNNVRDLVEQVGVADTETFTQTILVLYDGAMASSHVDGQKSEAAASARWAVEQLIDSQSRN